MTNAILPTFFGVQPITQDNVHSALKVDLRRRQLQAELAEIKKAFYNAPEHDQMTHILMKWHQQFTAALRLNSDVNCIEDEFTTLLQELLIDPLSHAPLDEDALLGTDGNTYDKKSFCIYLNSIPVKFHYRSPLAPEKKEFTTNPHPTVSRLVCWLRDKGKLLHCQKIEQEYQSLKDQKSIPVIPTNKSATIRRLQKLQAKRDKKQLIHKKDIQKKIDQTEKLFADMVQEKFSIIHQNSERTSKEQLKKIEEIKIKDEEYINKIKSRIENLEHKIKQLENQNEELDKKINDVNDAISEAEKDDMRLQVAINETRAAIQSRDSGWMNGLITACIIIGACCVATWALQGTLLSIGSVAKGTIIPTGQSSTMAILAFPI